MKLLYIQYTTNYKICSFQSAFENYLVENLDSWAQYCSVHKDPSCRTESSCCQSPVPFSQSERHNQYFTQNTRRLAIMFSLLQTKAQQLSKRLFRSKHIKVLKERYYYYYDCIIDCHAKILPSTGYENNIAQTKTDRWLRSPSHFSSFFTVKLLFKCHFVAL